MPTPTHSGQQRETAPRESSGRPPRHSQAVGSAHGHVAPQRVALPYAHCAQLCGQLNVDTCLNSGSTWNISIPWWAAEPGSGGHSVAKAQVKVGFSQSTHARGARKLSTFLCGQNCGYSRRGVWTSLWITLWTAPFRHVRRSCPTNAMSSLQCTCAPRFGLRCLDRSPRPPRAWEGRRCADEKGSRGPRARASPLSAPSRSAVPRRACSRRRRAHEA